ncbi:hypothetical protein A0J61_01720 [Choanephora cucurbitarum]|uniref:Uncharacterized protein n=1 Tax=Choanephora cucurbitarum TaxID=101091 RepID=A0A1C7NMG9_9FUNG|nr:hypothetical protein A0J61_01720 [Choanephora cucurbitarum]
MMSIKDRRSRRSAVWKRMPHQLKGLLRKKEELKQSISSPSLLSSSSFDATSSSLVPSKVAFAKTKQPPLIHRLFPSTKNRHKAVLQIKKQQWDQTETEFDIYEPEGSICQQLMSFLSPSFEIAAEAVKQEGWPQCLTTEKLDEMSRIYMATLHKIRLLGHFSLEQQLSIHRLLSDLQYPTDNLQSIHQQSLHKKSLLARVPHQHPHLFQREFSSLLSGKAMIDSVLLPNRKPRRTRYIFMLLSTPVSHIKDGIHPITETLGKLRKPFAETSNVIIADELEDQHHASFVPAEYLLDPVTLHSNFYNKQPSPLYHRLETKLSCTTITQYLSSAEQNMAKLGIQTN